MVDRLAGWWGRQAARLRATNVYVVDTAVAVVVAVPVAVPFVTAPPGGATLLGALLNAGTVLPLVWRRRWPFTMGLIVAVFAVLVSAYSRPGQMLQYGGLVAVYTVADLGRRWERWVYIPGVFVVLLLGALLVKDYTAAEFMFTHLLPLTACLLGALARSGRARARALEEKAAQLEREREADAARAVAEERARIARDMHDVLAHAVSIMVVQAEAGPVVVRSDPGRAEQALDAIAAAGRDAMVQLQRMLGVLNAEDSGAIRAPHPTLEAIPALVAQVRHTDLRVELRTTGERRPLSGDVEAAAYRIVQEALTNTVRHAAASLATVRLDWEADDLAIAVTDDGQGQPPARVWTGGHGLIGIHERAAACGGRADTGPAPGGGFQVTARLPYTQAERPVPRSTSVGRAGWASPHSGDADLEGR